MKGKVFSLNNGMFVLKGTLRGQSESPFHR